MLVARDAQGPAPPASLPSGRPVIAANQPAAPGTPVGSRGRQGRGRPASNGATSFLSLSVGSSSYVAASCRSKMS